MNPESSTELRSHKSGSPEDASNRLILDVQNAVNSGKPADGIYQASSSEHLPVVTISVDGVSQSETISRGHSFSVSDDGKGDAVVKQFDAKSGKQVSKDVLWAGGVVQDNLDSSGKVVSEDTHTPGNDHLVFYNPSGRENKSIDTDFDSLSGKVTNVENTTFSADGRSIQTHVHPNSSQPPETIVIRPDGTAGYIDYDPATGKPSAEEVVSGNNVSFYKFDKTTGKAAPDAWADLTDSLSRTLIEWSGAAIRPNNTGAPQ